MKNVICYLLLGLSLTACARWNLDKPIDEEKEREQKKRVPPPGMEY